MFLFLKVNLTFAQLFFTFACAIYLALSPLLLEQRKFECRHPSLCRSSPSAPSPVPKFAFAATRHSGSRVAAKRKKRLAGKRQETRNKRKKKKGSSDSDARRAAKRFRQTSCDDRSATTRSSARRIEDASNNFARM